MGKEQKEKPIFQQIYEKMQKNKNVISYIGPKPKKPKKFWSIAQQKWIQLN